MSTPKGFEYAKGLLHPMATTGLEVNFLVHLQSFTSKNFSTSKLVTPLAILSKCWGDLHDSNSQTFASRYFCHLQIINSYFPSFKSILASPRLAHTFASPISSPVRHQQIYTSRVTLS